MKRLLIATHNPAKVFELKKGLEELKKIGIGVVTLTDVGVEEEPEETGITFRENALLKARFYAEKTGLPTLADDGGIVIPHLNGEPGVKSSRWLGRKATDQELISYTLKRLSGVPHKNRNAYLELCLCLFDPRSGKAVFESEKIDGHLAEKPFSGFLPGFPYRALLVIDRFGKYYDALSDEEHAQINHRLKALRRLVPKIKETL